MNVVYNSQHYYVVEYAAFNGFELVDKQAGTGTFIQGETAIRFRNSLSEVIQQDSSAETVDEFLDEFGEIMTQPVTYH
jgi:Protein of unknown function (DUF3567)